MITYVFSIDPYFLGALVIAFVLAVISVWWSRSFIFKALALVALVAFVFLVFTAASDMRAIVRQVVSDFNGMIDDLLSRPKPVTFKQLQDMLPEGHRGHLVLYGEAKDKVGIYLLLRSPNISEPRYYLLDANTITQEKFQEAQRDARNKNTQLLLGGKPKKGNGKSGSEGGREGTGKEGREKIPGGGDDKNSIGIFHPAPVAGGPEKTSRPQDQPIVIPTPR